MNNVRMKRVTRLKQDARQSRRSLSQKALARLEASLTLPRRSGAEAVKALRRLHRRMTGAEIAETFAMPLSTVSGILIRIGLGKL